jgi:hypothetical protein
MSSKEKIVVLKREENADSRNHEASDEAGNNDGPSPLNIALDLGEEARRTMQHRVLRRITVRGHGYG